VVVLDNRLLGRSYGQMFIKSLPPATLLHGSLEEVYDKLADFFTSRGGSTAERVVSYDQI
jgi:Rad3-related DNA helicase